MRDGPEGKDVDEEDDCGAGVMDDEEASAISSSVMSISEVRRGSEIGTADSAAADDLGSDVSS
jgi:hypothetical protein